MALSLNLDMGANEYQQQAEQARLDAHRGDGKGGGGPSPIAVVLDLLGINHSVARAPKTAKAGDPTQTGDLASQAPGPKTKDVAVTDKKGNVVDAVHQVLQQADPAVQVKPLAMAPLEIGPLPQLSGQGIPRSIQAIDPNTGKPWG